MQKLVTSILLQRSQVESVANTEKEDQNIKHVTQF